jgi:hypothetical protein
VRIGAEMGCRPREEAAKLRVLVERGIRTRFGLVRKVA